jgi:hypothetical protein
LVQTSYTLNWLYPILAMIENPNPPAYEPVPLNDNDAAAAAATFHGDEEDAPTSRLSPGTPRTITSSVRAINRLLLSLGGIRSNFRGLWMGLVFAVATGLVGLLTSSFVPASLSFLATLPASLALVQLATIWLHTAIRRPDPSKRAWRSPPFRRTFEATCLPVLVNWVAVAVASQVPLLVARALGLPVWSVHRPHEVPAVGDVNPHAAAWQGLVVFLIGVLLEALLVLPSRVMLVRVQASLLPPDDDVIVPFDRSFQGKVQPEVIDGKGYVGMRDALVTFDRESWIRLYKLYAKLFGLTVAIYLAMAAVIIPEFMFFGAKR